MRRKYDQAHLLVPLIPSAWNTIEWQLQIHPNIRLNHLMAQLLNGE